MNKLHTPGSAPVALGCFPSITPFLEACASPHLDFGPEDHVTAANTALFAEIGRVLPSFAGQDLFLDSASFRPTTGLCVFGAVLDGAPCGLFITWSGEVSFLPGLGLRLVAWAICRSLNG